ncbi:hypothetical protein [Ferruginibacter sp.]
MDDLKKYLQQQKDAMDFDTPSPNVLKRIQVPVMESKKAPVRMLWWRVAAAACIVTVLSLGGWWLLYNKPAQTERPIAAEPAKEAAPVIAKAQEQQPDTIRPVALPVAATASKKKAGEKKLPLPYQLLYSFENNYTQLVKLQLKGIRSTPVYGESDEYFAGFKQNLHQLETDEASIKSNIKTNGLNDVLLEQLINVYQQKIDLLKNLQHEMNRMNNKVKENAQPDDSLKTHFITI